MSKKVQDRRIQRTRQLLTEALRLLILEKGYEAMTVQDVIDRANVGRSTFYAHFQDKEDLLLSSVEMLWSELEQHLLSAETDEETVWYVTLSMFQHGQSHRPVYKALVGKHAGRIALQHIQKQLYLFVFEHLKLSMSGQRLNFPLEILAHHLVSSFVSLLTWWLDNDASYSAEQMNEFYQQLVRYGVEPIFESQTN